MIAGIEMKSGNNVREIRTQRMSKTELARLAGVSAATIDRIEQGGFCRWKPFERSSCRWDSPWRRRVRFSPIEFLRYCIKLHNYFSRGS
jgi:hypothetical protein